MEQGIIILLVIIIVLLIYIVLRSARGTSTEGSLLMQQALMDLRKTFDAKMTEQSRSTQSAMQSQLSESSKLVRDVTKQLTKLDETNKQVVSFADQLQSLQDVLQNPKKRGVLGEYYLETVLKNVLPPATYEMQHSLGKGKEGGEIVVDAAIFVKDKVVPIDSKFSLENYNRLAESRDEEEQGKLEKVFKQDLKNRIDETAKYVKPQAGTTDFALMFIPSEAIFYDLLINKVGTVRVQTEDLVQYAAKKHVTIVSPNSFYAFLQVILQGLKQLEIEDSTKEILKNVEKLGKHIGSYDTYMQSLGKSLSVSVNHYNKAYKELGKVDKDVVKITGSASHLTPTQLDRPDLPDEE